MYMNIEPSAREGKSRADGKAGDCSGDFLSEHIIKCVVCIEESEAGVISI